MDKLLKLDPGNTDLLVQRHRLLGQAVEDTRGKLETLKTAQEQANSSAAAIQKIGAAGYKLQALGGNISSVGQKFLPVTGAVTALGAATVKTAADFDSAMGQVAVVSGATGSDLEALRAMAGWKTGYMLSGIEGIMNLAAASGEDLATTSDIVTDALTAFCTWYNKVQ